MTPGALVSTDAGAALRRIVAAGELTIADYEPEPDPELDGIPLAEVWPRLRDPMVASYLLYCAGPPYLWWRAALVAVRFAVSIDPDLVWRAEALRVVDAYEETTGPHPWRSPARSDECAELIYRYLTDHPVSDEFDEEDDAAMNHEARISLLHNVFVLLSVERADKPAARTLCKLLTYGIGCLIPPGTLAKLIVGALDQAEFGSVSGGAA